MGDDTRGRVGQNRRMERGDMKVLILGLGQYPKGSGVSAALFFAKRGDEVIATDLKTERELAGNVRRLRKYPNVRFRLGGHDLRDVRWADLIVRGPRVRSDSTEMREAKRLGKPTTSDIALFLEACPALVVGITGTRGKSTTSALIAEMLKASGRRVWLGGNILVSPLTFLGRVKKEDIVVLELSSWQLESMGERGVSPPVAVWTNLLRDHLNTYAGMGEYAEAKAQIFRHQRPEDIVFLPAEPEFDGYAESAPGRVTRVAYDVKRLKIGLIGEHNQRNAAMAASVAAHLGVDAQTIARVFKTFKGLPDRLEIVAKKKGVTFVNDTTSTTPDATIAALQAASHELQAPRSRIHLIFGGNDKELEFDGVAKEIERAKALVCLLPGTAHEKIIDALEDAKADFEEAADLRTAFRSIVAKMKSGDIVLLSPGCTSFGQFKNEFDRGEKYKRLVRRV